jgi:NAD(P)-dependent dehydrogenase (short-subunit alcohol dehydrogenase family)
MAHHGKFYIVTGGSSGIGEATALYLSQQGAHVGILDLQPPAAMSSNFLFEACDVSSSDSVKSAVAKMAGAAGRELVGVVNCAGINKPCPKLHEVTDEFYAKYVFFFFVFVFVFLLIQKQDYGY